MSDIYKAIIDNGYFSNSPKYWKVIIECNNLNDLHNICSAIHLIKQGGVKNND